VKINSDDLLPHFIAALGVYERSYFEPRTEWGKDDNTQRYFTDLCDRAFSNLSSLYNDIQEHGVTYSGKY
jgi:hypothetical protein